MTDLSITMGVLFVLPRVKSASPIVNMHFLNTLWAGIVLFSSNVVVNGFDYPAGVDVWCGKAYRATSVKTQELMPTTFCMKSY